MPPIMHEVLSSNVDRIGYDADARELLVTWKGGKTSAYSGVPPSLGENAHKNWSVGDFLNGSIKSHYPHRYV